MIMKLQSKNSSKYTISTKKKMKEAMQDLLMGCLLSNAQTKII